MSERAPYSRVYWSVMDDPKFQGIYEDDGAFACWVRLLMTADALWPQAPHLPRVKRRSLEMLVDAFIVELLPGHRYRIKGLDSERNRRAEKARDAAEVRWQSERIATASDDGMPSRAEHSQEEKSRAEKTWARAWNEIRRNPPTDKQRAVIDRYLSVMDRTGPERLARLFLEHPDDPIGAVLRDLDAFREERKAAALIAEKEAAERPRIVRGKSSPTRIGEVA